MEVLSRADFTFDADHNVYICPQGRPLTTTGNVNKDRTLYYRASKPDCDACPLKPKCCPKAPSRRIPRDIDEDARDIARSLVGTPAFEQSRRDRKKVEMSFAHLKRNFGLGRLRLRGPCGAQDEFLLAATAQNLMKLTRNIPRPPPLALACALRQNQSTNQMKRNGDCSGDQTATRNTDRGKIQSRLRCRTHVPNHSPSLERLLQQHLPTTDTTGFWQRR